MPRRPALSPAEMEVASTLWKLGTASVRQIHEALPEERRPDFSTVQTYLNRLETKGYVKSELRGRAKFFTGKVKPKKVISEAVDDFVIRLFGGTPLPLMRHLIDDGQISAEELAELRKLLDQHTSDSSAEAPSDD
ncbi:MAG: BlaI/MecI/CopY family transcriptional regulator [Lacipirellulaceae bacterium]